MALEDLNNWFENIRNPAEGIDPDTIISNITNVYTEDLSIRDAAVQARETELAEAREANRVLKEKNYDLLMKSPGSNVPGESNIKTDDPSDRSGTVTFADIFKKGDK